MINGQTGNKTVVGNYTKYEDALETANRLVEESYAPQDIFLFAEQETARSLVQNLENESKLQKRTSFTGYPLPFTVVPYDGVIGEEMEYLLPFHGSLDAGNIIVAVHNYRGISQDAKEAATLDGFVVEEECPADTPDNFLHTSPLTAADANDRINEI